MTESADDPNRRASRVDNRRRRRATLREAFSRAAERQPESGAGAARPCTRCCGSTLPRHYPFRARIQSYQAVAAPFPGDSVLPRALSRRDPTETRRFKRMVSGLRVEILFPFGNSQSFAGQKISNPAATRSPLPCDPRRDVASPHAGERCAVARRWSPRSERCRRWSCVGSRDPGGDGLIRRPSMSSFYQKEKSRKIAAG
jgi:hypothetical protein